MSVLFARAVVVPVWMILFALIALLAPSFGATTGLLQLGLALVVSALLAFMVSAVLGPVPHTTPLKERLAQCCLRSMWIHGPRLSCAECWGSSSAQARDFGMSGAFRRRSNDERAQHRTFARWCRPISATGHPGRHRAGWAYETVYEGALEGGPRCCEFMTRPS